MIKELAKNKMAFGGLVFIIIILFFAVFAPFVATYDPGHIDAKNILSPPSRAHIFGTDTLGRDIFSLNDKKANFTNTISWGNSTASFRWNHVFGPKLFLNTSLIFSDYKSQFAADQSDFEVKLFSGTVLPSCPFPGLPAGRSSLPGS